MSSVELPPVPSARSASACSSRSSLQSDRSAASRRSLAETLSDDDEQHELGGSDEQPQEPSGGLWDELESFLSKPSPSLAALAKGGHKPPPSQAKRVLPTLKAEAPRRSSRADNQGRPARRGSKAIDPKLLEEAFAFARKAQAQMLADEDADEDDAAVGGGRPRLGRRPSVRVGDSSGQSREFGSSASSATLTGASRPSAGLSSGNPRGRTGRSREADKPRKKAGERRPREPAAAAQWAAGEEGGADKGGKAGLDPQTVQELVSSLQSGAALEELRRELAASQQSLAMSRQVLHEAAKSFFRPS